MNTATDITVTELRTIKSTIKELELSLDKYMDADLSCATVRKSMRTILNNIAEMQNLLSNKLSEIK